MLAIIGGSGLTQLANLELQRREMVRTPYGEPSGPLTFGLISNQPAVFIARHGYGHTIPPHEVNYRANLWALSNAGATRIVSVASVGGIRADLRPGTLIVPHQIIDYTWGRKNTFYEGGTGPVVHIDFTEPYDEPLRQQLIQAARMVGEEIVVDAVYGATQGPRLETAAEITRMERDGADIVGMTGMPEAALARELDLSYAAIAVVVNFAAGRGDSVHEIHFENLQEAMQRAMGHVRRILEQVAVLPVQP